MLFKDSLISLYGAAIETKCLRWHAKTNFSYMVNAVVVVDVDDALVK